MNERASLHRLLTLGLVLVIIAVVFLLGLHRYLTLDSLRDNREVLMRFVGEHRAVAALAYVAVYALVVAFSLPGAIVMTLSGGFLFGVALGGALAMVGATLGAVAVFLTARGLLGAVLRRRAGPFLERMENGFRANAFHYLLFLRLVPAFPFWVINLVPALLGVSLTVFISATLIGIVPGTFIYSSFGAGLGEIFNAGKDISLNDFFSLNLVLGLLGLSLLALLPVVVQKLLSGRH